MPVAAILFISGEMNEYHSVVRHLQLGDADGGRVRIELPGEQNIVDDDVGVEVVSQILYAAIEIQVHPIAEPERGIRGVLVNEFEHPAALIERAGRVLADV